MGRWGTVALAALAVATTACSPGSAEPATSDEASTSATRTPRITDHSGRPPVTFDPCYDIPDDVMHAAGYDAGKKEVADMPMGTYTYLGCRYKGTVKIPGVLARYDLTLLSGNVSLDEQLAENPTGATPTTINGRPAAVRVDPDRSLTCSYLLQTSFGAVILNRLYHPDYPGGPPIEEWCTDFEELVSSIEPYVTD